MTNKRLHCVKDSQFKSVQQQTATLTAKALLCVCECVCACVRACVRACVCVCLSVQSKVILKGKRINEKRI